MVIGDFIRKISPAEDWVVTVTKPPGSGANPRWIMARKHPCGHFKQQGDLHIAYELMAYLLGDLLNLPIPVTTFFGYTDSGTGELRQGTVAIEDERHWGVWQQFEALPQFDKNNYKLSVGKMVSNAQDLRFTLPFDLWIRNRDRHGGNIIVSETSAGKKYKALLIDHSHAFFWREASEQSQFLTEMDDQGFRLDSVLHSFFCDLWTKIMSSRVQIDDILTRIGDVSDEDINSIVDAVGTQVPSFAVGYSAAMKEGLKRRRNKVTEVIGRKCDEIHV